VDSDPFVLLKLNDFKNFTEVVENGFDINKQDKEQRTLLYYACMLDRGIFVEYLIKKKVDLEKTTIDGDKAIHAVVANGNIVIAKMLINSGVDVNAAMYNGDTPLHVVALREYITPEEKELNDIEMTDLFLKNGADPNINNSDAEKPFHTAYLHGKYKLAKFLLPYTKDVTEDWVNKLKEK
jgi:ankyrin repeat protein